MKTTIIRFTKYAISQVLYHLGILHLIKKIKMRNKHVILTYHRILTHSEKNRSFSNPGIIVLDSNFDWQIGFIRRNFNIIDSETFEVAIRLGKDLPDYSCLITFDDGWSDNYTNAFPILRKHEANALIFLATDYIGSSRNGFWQETLANLLDHRLSEGTLHLERDDIQRLCRCPAHERKQAIFRFVGEQKKNTLQSVETLISDLRNAHPIQTPGNEIGCPIDSFMSWENAHSMLENGITFGSHTLSHKRLPFYPPDEIRLELEQSKSVISDRLGVSTRILAYPNGDYDDTVMKIAEESGYAIGFTTVKDLYNRNMLPMRIPRINIHDGNSSTPAMLMTTILGIF